MKNNLVLSPLEGLFKKTNKNIVLGKWYYKEIFKKKYNVKLSKYNFYSLKRKKITYKFLKKKYDQKILEFVHFFNEIHNLKKDKRYWEIIIGPFIYRSLIIAWDRWESLNKSIKFERINNITLSNYNFSKFLTKNNLELNQNYSNIFFNHFLYSEAFKLIGKKGIKIKYINNSKIKIKRLTYLKTGFINKIWNLFFKFVREKQKFLFYKSYFPIAENIILNFKLRNFPSFPDEFDKNFSKTKVNFELRNKELKFKKKDKFDRYYSKIILKIMPMSYLEDFKIIKKYTDNISLNPKLVFTAIGHLSIDSFKIWTAGKVSNGLKLITSDHGGNLEDEGDFFSHRIYDKIIQWNKTNYKNVIQLPPNIFSIKKKIFLKRKTGKILIILTCTDYFKSNIFDRDANDYDDYIKFKKLLKHYDKNEQKKFYFRVHPGSPFKEFITKDIKKNFGDEKCDELKFEKIIYNYDLIIDTNPQTTYIQCMHSGVPTLLYYNNSFIKVNRDINILINKMKKNKLIFTNLKNLKTHLEKVQKNPEIWWNSKKIENVKKHFSDKCSLQTKNDLNVWKNFFYNYEKNN